MIFIRRLDVVFILISYFVCSGLLLFYVQADIYALLSMLALIFIACLAIYRFVRVLTKHIGLIECQFNHLDNKIDLSKRLELSGTFPAHQLPLNINQHFDICEESLASLSESIGRLTPISTDLSESYANMTQKSQLQAGVSQVVADDMEKVWQSTEEVLLLTSAIIKGSINCERCVADGVNTVEESVDAIHRLEKNG